MKSLQQLSRRLGIPIAAKRSKYGNTKCEWRGQKFDSKRELERYLVLRDMEKKDEIRNLVRQPEFKLIVNGELICKYRSDFAYDEPGEFLSEKGLGSALRGWHRVIEDSKGFQTKDWAIKFKLAKALFRDLDWRTS